MNKRFMLTAAGAAATGFAGAASGCFSRHVMHGLDRWNGEHSFQVYSSNGAFNGSWNGIWNCHTLE